MAESDRDPGGTASEGSPTEVAGMMLICDGAQSVGGKLYVLGGGWSILQWLGEGSTYNVSLAIKLSIPWTLANERMTLLARLVTADGEGFEVEGEVVQAEGDIEVGRPAGLRPGTPLDVPIALNFSSMPLVPGGYLWELLVDGRTIARQPFQVVEQEGQGGASFSAAG